VLYYSTMIKSILQKSSFQDCSFCEHEAASVIPLAVAAKGSSLMLLHGRMQGQNCKFCSKEIRPAHCGLESH
jgi:hypothetical protein